jgi:molybdate transport system substrate-binding protein
MKWRTFVGARPASAIVVLVVLSLRAAASADDILVMTSGAFTAPYLELAPGYERSTGNKFKTLATSMGTGTDSIPNRLRRGEHVDIVIVAADALDALIDNGMVRAGSRVDLARSSIGMAVKSGARRPDISSVDALRRTLLEARSVAYSASVSGDYLVNELFPKLGVANELQSKGMRIERERVGDVVARGDAEIGFQQLSELLPIKGLDLVGPLPREVQRVTVFAAGIAASSTNIAAARAFIDFLASPSAASVIAKSGLEPLSVK